MPAVTYLVGKERERDWVYLQFLRVHVIRDRGRCVKSRHIRVLIQRRAGELFPSVRVQYHEGIQAITSIFDN